MDIGNEVVVLYEGFRGQSGTIVDIEDDSERPYKFVVEISTTKEQVYCAENELRILPTAE